METVQKCNLIIKWVSYSRYLLMRAYERSHTQNGRVEVICKTERLQRNITGVRAGSHRKPTVFLQYRVSVHTNVPHRVCLLQT